MGKTRDFADFYRFPEERVVCLAQVLGNIQFMGCRYPNDTMTQVRFIIYKLMGEGGGRLKLF